MATFNEKIIGIEGSEYTNDPKDKGGETKYGISKRSYPKLDIKNLTENEAVAIYKKDFWDKNNLSSLVHQEMAEILFYLIVHSGAETAICIAQRAANKVGNNLKVDGKLGPMTMAALNISNVEWLEAEFRVLVCAWYLRIVDKDKSQAKYFIGWIRRALT